MIHERTDYLVIGSGIAGLSFALRTAQADRRAKVTVVTKSSVMVSNTRYAQGGLASVIQKDDSFDKHIHDTLLAGDGLCDPEAVKTVVEETPAQISELQQWGASFDKTETGQLHLSREGGHSESRVVHRGDFTGLEIQEVLVRQVRSMSNITVREHMLGIDLTCAGNTCTGLLALDPAGKVIIHFSAAVTVIACGGTGQVYRHTTNPRVATGDGIAMAWRAGVRVANMEYMQFHPTALYSEEDGPLFLISEAVRGAGARLLDHNGRRFMGAYDQRLELASRDVVSRAVYSEMRAAGKCHVWMDCRHISAARFRKEFPTIHEKCLSLGLDPSTSLLPVVPAAHYCCGGVSTDLNGQTSMINLLAIGESACTGLHGANRLASNSLPEALVFAARASRHALKNRGVAPVYFGESMVILAPEKLRVQPDADVKKLQELMSGTAIVASDHRLRIASNKVEAIVERYGDLKNVVNAELVTFRNIACIARLILEACLRQNLNRGAFYKISEQEDALSAHGDFTRSQT